VRIVHTEPVRGKILDATGRPIVDNRLSIEVRVNQQQLGGDPEGELLHLSDVLGVKVRKIRERLADVRYYPYQSIPVAVDVDEDVAFYIREHQREFPGVEVIRAAVRTYPQGRLGAQMLGWIGQIDADQLKEKRFRNYGQNDLVGKAGLESQYERWLRGDEGVVKYLVNSAGENIREIGSKTPEAGDDLVLSIDARIQRLSEQALVQGIERARTYYDESQDPPGYLRANAGAVVVLDPATGGVKAMASWPTFDPSWFVDGPSRKQLHYLFQSDQQPMLVRATQLSYAPGSTFKPFVALSAVKSGVASLSGSYPCPPEYVYPTDPDHPFHNWSSSDYGYLSIASALKVSCDTVFYGFGGAYWSRYHNDQFGQNSLPLQRDLREFGFGRSTGIDLPETSGLIPNPNWKEQFADSHPEVLRPDERSWLPGDDILMSIGQGFVTVTPLQLASAYAVLANGGKLCRPHVADHIVDPVTEKVVKRIGGRCRKVPYTQTELNYIRDALTTVPQPGGTAAVSFVGFPLSEYPIAAKTGTAQRTPFQDTSWFAAIVPADDPQYVVVAMVEQGGHGSTTAAPIVRQVIESIYGIEAAGPGLGNSVD
jgi:penicillin-binding protein 2